MEDASLMISTEKRKMKNLILTFNYYIEVYAFYNRVHQKSHPIPLTAYLLNVLEFWKMVQYVSNQFRGKIHFVKKKKGGAVWGGRGNGEHDDEIV